MYFDSFADFIEMGRHGFYVWTAYGVSAALVVANLVVMLRRHRRVRLDIRRGMRREQLIEDRDGQ